MEYYDVFDKNRNSLNYKKLRGSIMQDHEYNQGVEILIFNNNRLLITKRSLNKSHPLMWEVPGGCSQTCESSRDTLIREIKEEIGVDLNNRFRLLDTQIYKKQFVDIYISDILIELDKVKLEKDEVCDIMLVTKNEFLEMINNNLIVPGVVNRFNNIKDKLSNYW